MLKIMEDEIKIFRAWLKKYIQDHDGITGKAIAEKTKISAQRFSQYYSGRVDNGIRTYPKIPFEIRQAILEATGVSYNEAMRIGRQELKPTTTEITEDHIKVIVEEAIEKKFPATPDTKIINASERRNIEHHETVDKFKDQKTALSINQKLVKIESLDPKKLGKIEKLITLELEELEARQPENQNQGERKAGEG